MLRRSFLGFLIALLAASGAAAQDPGFPNRPDALRFAVIGDAGTGDNRQKAIGSRLAAVRQHFPFEFVLMLGDNIYGDSTPEEFKRKFEQPFAELLNAGVQFYAALGNHDDLAQRFYPFFHMGGRRYYTFSPGPQVRVITLDSPRMDEEHLRWLREELGRPSPAWTLVIMHHPLYSSGKRHGPSLRLQTLLEPMFVASGVDAVFAGHEHFYERLRPQSGVHYFISGAAGQLRRGNILASDQTACGFDQDNSFMLVELTADVLEFASMARDGTIVDRGTILREERSSGLSADCLGNR